MAFCTEVEDVISMSLAVITSLLEKYKIDPIEIGRLEVSSETVIDKSKSIKTFLMQILEKCVNTDIKGVDSTNACYGGTAALFNCVNWVESASWMDATDLLYAQIVRFMLKGQLSLLEEQLIAMLIEPKAPIAFESKFRCSHMSHAYDSYKPNIASEYPVFLSELVQKSFARLYFNDFLRNVSFVDEVAREKLAPFSALSGDESYQTQDLEKASQQVAKQLYDLKVQPSTLIPKQVSDMYTASFCAAFGSLLQNKHSSMVGKWVIMFTYESDLTATMLSFKLQDGQHPFSLSNIVNAMNIPGKLKLRNKAVSS